MPGQTAAIACCVAVGVSACGGGGGGDDELVVFAAASLREAMADIGDAFERSRGDVDVLVSSAGSSSLREQILDGAPAAVFASANDVTMSQVVDAGETSSTPVVFATNALVLAVPAGNPGGITDVADLERDDLFIGLCAADVPCGDLARQVLDASDVDAAVDTDEPDVRALLTKLDAAELDAGIVYATDVLSVNGSVEAVATFDVLVEYPIAALRSGDPDLRTEFVGFAQSAEARTILERHGFGVP